MSSLTLKQQAIRGTIWTVIGYGTGQVLRLGSNLILTRLLAPELFGLMALINVFIIGLNMFSDIGIGPNIIQNKRGEDPEFINTAWTMQVIRGFGLWLACLLITWPISNFYGDPRLLWLIPIVGLSTIISGFNSTNLPMLNRRMAIGKMTIFGLVMQIVNLTVLIIWACLSPSIWALVGAGLFSNLLTVIFSHRLIPGTSNYFTWDKTVAKEIFSFSKWIFVSTATAFLAMQADRLILGKLFPLEILGVYTVALTFAQVPKQLLGTISGKIIFPIISKFKDLPRKSLKAKILNKRSLLLIGIAFLVAVLFSFGDLLILVLYDKRYEDASWMLPILSLGLWPIILGSLNNSFLIGLGKPMYASVANCLKLIYMAIVLPLGFSLMGVIGAVLAIAFNDLPGYAVFSYGLWREKLGTIVQDIQVTILLFGLITIFLVTRYFLGFGISIDGIL